MNPCFFTRLKTGIHPAADMVSSAPMESTCSATTVAPAAAFKGPRGSHAVGRSHLTAYSGREFA